ncbi:phosphotransferase enzyme family-domain-containing protein [Hypoxylon fuscum]|nr:phosphotransferase enzyme family-domain-containing protein [Hypoxylon fuscum]
MTDSSLNKDASPSNQNCHQFDAGVSDEGQYFNRHEEENVDTYKLEWSQLETRIQNLCLDLWPSADCTQTTVFPLAEGGNNLAIAIYIVDGDEISRYILRLPRFKEFIRDHVAIPKYLAETTSLPIPRILFYDLTSDNALQYPYMVMDRVPGIDLSKALNGRIGHKQRLNIAKDLGRIQREMNSIKSNRAGWLRAIEEGSLESDVCVQLQPFGVHRGDPDIEYQLSRDINAAFPMMVAEAGGKPCREIMLDAVARCRQRANEEGLDEELVGLWEKMGDMFTTMDKRGLFSNDDIRLLHGDFEARNIMVEMSMFDNTLAVTGILDWDYTLFMPKFLGNKPPSYLWTEKVALSCRSSTTSLFAKDLETFGGLTTEPATEEMAEVKRVFEESVGECYTSKPFARELYLADRLLEIVFYDPEDILAGKECLEAWEELQQDRELQEQSVGDKLTEASTLQSTEASTLQSTEAPDVVDKGNSGNSIKNSTSDENESLSETET